jgi:serine/threonine protein kinase/Ca2+-binding EF-hand superfamily protein
MGNAYGTPSLASFNPDNASQIFAALDVKRQGYLTLQELMSAGSPGVVLPHSLPALYFVDTEKNGRITRSEFAALLRFCQVEKQKAHVNVCRDKVFRDVITRASAAGVKDCSSTCRTSFRRFSSHSNVRSLFSRNPSAFNLAMLTSDAEAAHGVATATAAAAASTVNHASCCRPSRRPPLPTASSTPVPRSERVFDPMDSSESYSSDFSRQAAQLDLSPPSSSSSASSSSSGSSSTSSESLADSEVEDSGDAGSGQPQAMLEPLDAKFCTAIDAAVIEGIARFHIHKLADMLHTECSRELFMQWLWKLVDFNANGMITLEELRVFLAALEEDGIDLQELAFYRETGASLGESIINEFDTTHTGVLEQDEFMVLADLVTREYEHWENRHLDCIGNYELGRTIGRGSSGVVRLGVNVETHEKFAVKIVRKGQCTDMCCVDREIQALKSAKQEHIVGLEEVLESEENVFLILELCGGGSLSSVVRLHPGERMPEAIARLYIRQMFEALAFCHGIGICHRDFRLENVLLNNDGVVKITDFGHSKMFVPGSGWDIHSTMLVGSVYNLSPEQVEGKLYSGEKIDIWSTGICLYCLLVGHPPFYDQDTVTLLANVSTGTFLIPSHVSSEASDLIRCMIRVPPDERVPLCELLQHPWFYSGDTCRPDMDIYSIPVDDYFKKRPDLAQMIMAGTIHEHNLHFHLADALNPKSSPDDLRGQEWSLKCLCPQMDIKFSISLFTKPPTVRTNPRVLQSTPSRADGALQAEQVAAFPALPSPSMVVPEPYAFREDDFDSDGDSIDDSVNSERATSDVAGEYSYSAIGSESWPPHFNAEPVRSKSLGGCSTDDSLSSILRRGNGEIDAVTDDCPFIGAAHGDTAGDPTDVFGMRSASRLCDKSKQFDAFPYQRVIPRKKMPEATRLFNSDRRIAAAAAAARACKIPRSYTIDSVVACASSGVRARNGKGSGLDSSRLPSRVGAIRASASITKSLAHRPSRGHTSQSPRP